jgi:hypothetical protein
MDGTVHLCCNWVLEPGWMGVQYEYAHQGYSQSCGRPLLCLNVVLLAGSMSVLGLGAGMGVIRAASGTRACQDFACCSSFP